MRRAYDTCAAVVGRCVFSDSEVLDNFIDVGGDVEYLQEAASDVYAARGWIFGFGFCFSTASCTCGGNATVVGT